MLNLDVKPVICASNYRRVCLILRAINGSGGLFSHEPEIRQSLKEKLPINTTNLRFTWINIILIAKFMHCGVDDVGGREYYARHLFKRIPKCTFWLILALSKAV